MTREARQALELDGALELVGRYLGSPLGRRRLEEFAPTPLLGSPDAARLALDEAGEAMDWLRAAEAADRRGLTPPPRFQALRDVFEPAEALQAEGSVLEAQEILGLLDVLDRAEETRQRLWRERARRPRLGAFADRLADFSAVLRDLGGKILPNGELADHASPTLSRLRRQLERQRQAVQESLERFVRRHFDRGALQDDYATIRNGRSVVPVKAEWKGRVEGVFHTASSTGRTLFVEPLETIAENNRLVELRDEEQAEVLRILREMTERLRAEGPAVREAVSTLADLDFVFAKARFGRDFRCCLPTFSTRNALRLEWARHPLLEDVLRREGRKSVPLSLELAEGGRVLVISGPNAGGKTVTMKTVGLLALMARAGMPVPAAAAEFPWFETVLADIGDAQSIDAGLSTFSAHVGKLKAMLDAADGRTLAIVDELGGATDPDEGGALAVAVVDWFLERGAFALVSTHLPALKFHAGVRSEIVSAAMGFDEATFSPTYKLLVGVPGQSAGLAMAERLGMPAELIARARQALSERDLEAGRFIEKLRSSVEEHEERERRLKLDEQKLRERERELEREAAERDKRKAAELERRFETALREAKLANQRLLDEALAKVERAAEGKRAMVAAQRTVARVQRETGERMQSAVSEALGREAAPELAAAVAQREALREGAAVRLGGFGAQGRLLRKIGEDQWEVEVGQLKMRVTVDDISEVIDSAQERKAALPDGVRFTPAEKSDRPAGRLDEINVIGRRVDEAEDDVDRFLDRAVLSEVERVRVVHGHGTNALRRALWRLFANHVHVERYYQAETHEGGGGATIVELKT
jgi:DNA mismatch repair protein MutS2